MMESIHMGPYHVINSISCGNTGQEIILLRAIILAKDENSKFCKLSWNKTCWDMPIFRGTR